MQYDTLEKIVKPRMSEKRYNHTVQVARLSKELAMHYNIDPESAITAAMLHDATKELDTETQLQTIKNSDIIFDDMYETIYNLQHGVTAYLFARDECNVADEDVLNAIKYHTTGRAGMSMLEKIVYIADKVSYERSYQGVEELRKLSFEDIDMCMFEVLKFLFNKLISKKLQIAMDTVYCYNEIVVAVRG